MWISWRGIPPILSSPSCSTTILERTPSTLGWTTAVTDFRPNRYGDLISVQLLCFLFLMLLLDLAVPSSFVLFSSTSFAAYHHKIYKELIEIEDLTQKCFHCCWPPLSPPRRLLIVINHCCCPCLILLFLQASQTNNFYWHNICINYRSRLP